MLSLHSWTGHQMSLPAAASLSPAACKESAQQPSIPLLASSENHKTSELLKGKDTFQLTLHYPKKHEKGFLTAIHYTLSKSYAINICCIEICLVILFVVLLLVVLHSFFSIVIIDNHQLRLPRALPTWPWAPPGMGHHNSLGSSARASSTSE